MSVQTASSATGKLQGSTKAEDLLGGACFLSAADAYSLLGVSPDMSTPESEVKGKAPVASKQSKAGWLTGRGMAGTTLEECLALGELNWGCMRLLRLRAWSCVLADRCALCLSHIYRPESYLSKTPGISMLMHSVDRPAG
jgi:hypothetical protein